MKILLFLCLLFFSNSSFAEKIDLICEGKHWSTIDRNTHAILSQGIPKERLLEIDIENNKLLFYHETDYRAFIFDIVETSGKIVRGEMEPPYGNSGFIKDTLSIDRYNGEMEYRLDLGYSESNGAWLRQYHQYICKKRDTLF